MKMIVLHCPNCGGNLEIEDGIDTFFCKYCGYKIILEGQDPSAIQAKVNIRRMEHKESLVDKKYAHERYKNESEKKTFSAVMVGCLAVVIVSLALLFGLGMMEESEVAKQEANLQAIVDEIMIDIEKNALDEAYVKANSLYWDSSWSSEGKRKWDATRKALLKTIEEARKAK